MFLTLRLNLESGAAIGMSSQLGHVPSMWAWVERELWPLHKETEHEECAHGATEHEEPAHGVTEHEGRLHGVTGHG